MIQENLAAVEENIRSACRKSGRNEQDVTLIAVGKTKPADMLKEAYDAGCRHFGENKAQELLEKYEILPKDIKWHMIGHLQRNKVKYIIDKVYLIHSVDSYRLAEEINKEAKKRGIVANILIEVNIAEEESKYGVLTKDAEALITKASQLTNISIKGLMCVAPYVENPENNRQYFVKLHHLYVDILHKNIDNVFMNTISMGMTGDYQVAVEEGATCVRVGTGIFGERDYTVVNAGKEI